MRAAVVGAGPSGFYTAEQLLAAGFEVDVIDALPTPFGLVRAGVAPDHPKIKSVTRVYAKTAHHERFRFFGGVRLGRDVSRGDLLARYHAVIYATGTSIDNRLGIAGEDRPGSHSATEFVAWYNGHPHYSELEFDLACHRAVVIGNGNVALDVARMLVLDSTELMPTDTADHAISTLRATGIREVVLIGRRGPAEAAFTNPELRELGGLARVDVVVDPSQLEGLENPTENARRQSLELLRNYAGHGTTSRSHRLELRFMRSPIEILGDGAHGRVTGVRVGINRLVCRPDGSVFAEPTGEEELIECGLVLRSIGYRGEPMDEIPFDERRGLIRNVGGRVIDDSGVCRGEYAVGWIKRGPSGVIGTNKKDATETVANLLEDAERGALNEPDEGLVAEAAGGWLLEQSPETVTWDGWTEIDKHEVASGESQGRPRVKLVRIQDMVDVARKRSGVPS